MVVEINSPPVSRSELAFGFHDLHFNDGEVELVGFSSAIHLGACVSGTDVSKPIRIAQGRVITIVMDDDIPCQYDGEPYLQPMDCTLLFTHIHQAKMLRKVK